MACHVRLLRLAAAKKVGRYQGSSPGEVPRTALQIRSDIVCG